MKDAFIVIDRQADGQS